MPTRRLFVRSVLLTASAMALSGCGFQPVFGRLGDGQSASNDLAEIEVGLLDGRYGQLVRQALQRRLEGASSAAVKRYDLSVNFSYAQEGVALQESDSNATRARSTGTASWTLLARDAKRTSLASGFARASDGFNIFDQQNFYSDLSTERAVGRIADNLADQISVALAAYFRTHGHDS